jgi:hypothetical protein
MMMMMMRRRRRSKAYGRRVSELARRHPADKQPTWLAPTHTHTEHTRAQTHTQTCRHIQTPTFVVQRSPQPARPAPMGMNNMALTAAVCGGQTHRRFEALLHTQRVELGVQERNVVVGTQPIREVVEDGAVVQASQQGVHRVAKQLAKAGLLSSGMRRRVGVGVARRDRVDRQMMMVG